MTFENVNNPVYGIDIQNNTKYSKISFRNTNKASKVDRPDHHFDQLWKTIQVRNFYVSSRLFS